MNDIVKNSTNKKVRQSNHFVESPYAQEFTATELKILELAVADCKVTDTILVKSENNKKFEFTTKDLSKLLNTSVSTLSHEAERLSKSIIKKFIHGRKELPNGDIEFETIAIIPYTKYENGIFAFELNHKLLPYFIDINMEFTEYSLQYLMNLKSAYGIKLYKLLFQYRRIGKRTFSIKDLRAQFGVSDEKYQLYSNFKNRILDVSVSQINQFTDLSVSYRELKICNKISDIEFKFIIKNNLLDSPNKINPDKLDEKLQLIVNNLDKKISENTKKIMIDYFNKNGILYIESSIEYAKNHSKKNFDKYLQDTLQNEWATIKMNEIIQVNQQKIKTKKMEAAQKLKDTQATQLIAKKTFLQFQELSVDEKTTVLADLISKISNVCPDRLQEILKEQDEYTITYWAKKNNLAYKGNFHLKLDYFLKSKSTNEIG